ncbi:MAG: 50S ribosomal protein L15 [Deltaproteobacteria bacterium]|nr:50S ribosomal protein L15 [Deltaproteobacteria bacterium]
MKFHEIQIPAGSRKKSKRVGRGPGSGLGKTCGRGTKGQNSRSGSGTALGFEGGQMPLKRRLPKRGFTNKFKKKFALVNVQDLERFDDNATIDPSMILKVGLIKKLYDGVKILGKGKLTKPLTVRAHRISGQAKEKIEKAGGQTEAL